MLEKTLTPELHLALEQLSNRRRSCLMELRLRSGGVVQGVYPWGEEPVLCHGTPIQVTERLLQTLLGRATGFSPNALRLEESGLYLPLEDGCRMGLCGEAVIRDNRLVGLRKVSSLVIRLARAVPGVARRAAELICAEGMVCSTLILGPPGSGKTTFLRDLVRCISCRGFRVSVADERREIAAAKDGVPQLDLGPCTDVLSGCPKAQALPLLLRVMNPQVLAVDELSGKAETGLVWEAANAGTALLATVHGRSISQLRLRPGWEALLSAGVFSWIVSLRGPGDYQIERLDGHVEGDRSLLCGTGLLDGGNSCPAGNGAPGSALASDSVGAGADAGGNGAAYAFGGGAVF